MNFNQEQVQMKVSNGTITDMDFGFEPPAQKIKNDLELQFNRKYRGSVGDVFRLFMNESDDDIPRSKTLTISIVKKGITERELGFLMFIVEEGLSSACKNGISIIDHGTSFEIHSGSKEKIIDGDLYDNLSELFNESFEEYGEFVGFVGFDSASSASKAGKQAKKSNVNSFYGDTDSFYGKSRFSDYVSTAQKLQGADE